MAIVAFSKKTTFVLTGVFDLHDGRQKIPVVVTPYKKMAS
jgi:hypothetical protein